MSLTTWKQEFYSIEASDLVKSNSNDLVAIVKHSLRKWKGLRSKNLRKHRLVYNPNIKSIQEEGTKNTFTISMHSCSLCKYAGIQAGVKVLETPYWKSICGFCPLYKVRANVPCDRISYTQTSPWGIFVLKGDPEPMIRDLKETLKAVKKGLLNDINTNE